MTETLKFDPLPGALFSIVMDEVSDDALNLTIGIHGPKYTSRQFRTWFEIWCKKYNYPYSINEDYRKNGIRERHVSLKLSFTILLELILYDIDEYEALGYPFERDGDLTEDSDKLRE